MTEQRKDPDLEPETGELGRINFPDLTPDDPDLGVPNIRNIDLEDDPASDRLAWEPHADSRGLHQPSRDEPAGSDLDHPDDH